MKKRFLHALSQPQHQVSMGVYETNVVLSSSIKFFFCLRLHQKLSQSMKIKKKCLRGMPPDPPKIRNITPAQLFMTFLHHCYVIVSLFPSLTKSKSTVHVYHLKQLTSGAIKFDHCPFPSRRQSTSDRQNIRMRICIHRVGIWIHGMIM